MHQFLKRKRNCDLERQEPPLKFEDSYLYWIPLVVMEDILPLCTYQYWMRDKNIDPGVGIWKSFPMIARIDSSRQLFNEFRNHYLQAIDHSCDAFGRCIRYFEEKYPKTCFICHQAERKFLTEGSVQFHILYDFPEWILNAMHFSTVRTLSFAVPCCDICHNNDLYPVTSLVWLPGTGGSSGNVGWRVFFSFQEYDVLSKDSFSADIFTYEITSNAVVEISSNGHHVIDDLHNELMLRVGKVQFTGLFPYISFNVKTDFKKKYLYSIKIN